MDINIELQHQTLLVPTILIYQHLLLIVYQPLLLNQAIVFYVMYLELVLPLHPLVRT